MHALLLVFSDKADITLRAYSLTEVTWCEHPNLKHLSISSEQNSLNSSILLACSKQLVEQKIQI